MGTIVYGQSTGNEGSAFISTSSSPHAVAEIGYSNASPHFLRNTNLRTMDMYVYGIRANENFFDLRPPLVEYFDRDENNRTPV